MNLIDYDKDNGKIEIIFETTHEELFHFLSAVEFAKSSFISDYDREVMQKFHDEFLHVLSWFS